MVNISGLRQLLPGIRYLYNARARVKYYRHRFELKTQREKKYVQIASGPLASGTCFSVNTLRNAKGEWGGKYLLLPHRSRFLHNEYSPKPFYCSHRQDAPQLFQPKVTLQLPT